MVKDQPHQRSRDTGTTPIVGPDQRGVIPGRQSPATASTSAEDSDRGLSIRGADLLDWRRGLLLQGGCAVALDWLLQQEAGLSWAALQRLRIDPDRTVELRVGLERLQMLWHRHCSHHEPLQYLVGRSFWRDCELVVAPGVLIPRQETELVVELAHCLSESAPPDVWADLGTGSGCLAIALAQLWPASEGLAVDCSAQALQLADLNLRRSALNRRVRLVHGHWWEPLRPWWGRLQLVVANPPYIPSSVWASLEPIVKNHEPRLALDGGEDGLDAIRTIAAGAVEALAPGGWLVLEHHHDQSSAVGTLLAAAGLVQVVAHADLEGKSRFAAARLPVTPLPRSSSGPAGVP